MSNLFITVLNMSLTASYVALAIIFIRLLLKKAPKIFSYVLWTVVLFRLICPISFESTLSLIPGKTDVIPQDIVYSQNPAISTGIGIVDNTMNQSIQSSLPQVNPTNSINPMGLVIEIGTIIWILGILILLSYGVVSYLRLKSRVSTATLVKENILETDMIKTPFVLGFIKPKIYIPIGISESELNYILQHEQTHIRRCDYIIKPLTFLVAILHWFNPLVWISYFLMIKDMEMSCDESVMKKAGGDIRASYSNSLLSLSVKQSGLLSPLAFGESNVKSRIKNVLNYKRPTFWLIIIAIVAVVVATVGLLTNPIKEEPYENRSNEDAIINLVEGFGSKLQMVSLLAPKDIVAKGIKENYSGFVSQTLIEKWINDSENAPGRVTSSPWPDRIEVLSVEKLSEGTYQVNGEVIAVTSVEKVSGGVARKRSIKLIVKKIGERWLIDALTMGKYENSLVSTDGQANSITIKFENENDFSKQYREEFSDYITELFTKKYKKYYQVKGFEFSNVKLKETETNIEFTFFLKMINQNFYKDPDTVGYIKQAKENGSKHYRQLYEEYNQPKESNYDLKFTAKVKNGKIDKESIILFTNVSPKGVKYEPVDIGSL